MTPPPPTPSAEGAVVIARRLAACLDAADHNGAAALLAPDCTYTFRGRTIQGGEAIIASYAAAHADALATFDSIAYESGVRADEGAAAAIIRYGDIITHNGIEHRHECEQRITTGVGETGGLVVRIEHVDLPGQHEALNAWLMRVGLPARPPLDS